MPKSRRDRFKTLLRVRQIDEDRRAQELAQVRREIRAATSQLEEIAGMQRTMRSKAGNLLHGAFFAEEVRAYYQFERHLGRLADDTDALIAELRTVEAERRGILENAMKSRRIAERLDERTTAAWHAFVEEEDRSQTDELAVVRAAAQRRVGP